MISFSVELEAGHLYVFFPDSACLICLIRNSACRIHDAGDLGDLCHLIFPLDIGDGTGITVSGYRLLHPSLEQMVLLRSSCITLHNLGFFGGAFFFCNIQYVIQPLLSSLLRWKVKQSSIMLS